MKMRNMMSAIRESLVGSKAFAWLLPLAGIRGRLRVPGMDAPAENFVWVMNCVTARSEAIMQAPLRISDADDNIIEGGDLFDLLAKPNRWMDGVQFLGAIESFRTVFNAAHIVPIAGVNQIATPNGGLKPDELIMLSPANLSPIVGVHKPTGTAILMGWKHLDGLVGTPQSFTIDEVIPIESFNPHNPLKALNPMSALRYSLLMDGATRECNLSLFQNGGIPDIALETDKDMKEDQAKEFLQKFMDNYGGLDKAHKPAMLYNGIKINKIGLNPAELQSVEVLKTLTPQEIVSGLRTKPIMAGLMVGETGLSGGTSTNEQKVAWWSETGNSEVARIAAALQQKLVDPYEWSGTSTRKMSRIERIEFRRQWNAINPHVRSWSRSLRARNLRDRAPKGRPLFVWFDTSLVPELQEMRWKRTDQFQKYWQMGYKPDELNDYFDAGLPPHADNKPRVPFSLTVIGEEEQPPAPVQSTMQGKASATGQTRSDVLFDEIERLMREDSPVPKKFKKSVKAFNAFLEPREKAAAKRWSRFYIEQRGRVMERIKAIRESRSDADDMMRKVFPRHEEDAALVGRLSPIFAEHMKDGWSYFFQETGTDEKANPFEINDPRVMQALEKRKVQGTEVNATTQEDLRKIIGDAFQEGLSTVDMGDKIAEYYNAHCIGEDAARPMTAARTQTSGIINEGRNMAANEVGGLVKHWVLGGSETHRPGHEAAMMKYADAPIPTNEKFEIQGADGNTYLCDCPGSTELPVGEVANCGCGMAFGKPGEN
jgi:phage portal protein BeeE